MAVHISKRTKANAALKSELAMEPAQAVAAVKDVQQLQAVNQAVAKASLEAAQSYTKTLYALATEARAQYAALADDAWTAYSKAGAAWVDKVSKAAPAGSEAAVSAFKQGFAASTAAYDQFKEASRKVVSLADASVRAAAANVGTAAAPAKGTPERLIRPARA